MNAPMSVLTIPKLPGFEANMSHKSRCYMFRVNIGGPSVTRGFLVRKTGLLLFTMSIKTMRA